LRIPLVRVGGVELEGAGRVPREVAGSAQRGERVARLQQRVRRERLRQGESGGVVGITAVGRVAEVLVDVIDAGHQVAPDLRLDAGRELVLARTPLQEQRRRLEETTDEGV